MSWQFRTVLDDATAPDSILREHVRRQLQRELQPCPCGDSCSHPGSAYRCQRCEKLVCWCDGADGAAICCACWSALDACGWAQSDMDAMYNADDVDVLEPIEEELRP
jgi:hypothetical protein